MALGLVVLLQHGLVRPVIRRAERSVTPEMNNRAISQYAVDPMIGVAAHQSDHHRQADYVRQLLQFGFSCDAAAGHAPSITQPLEGR